MYKKGVYDSAFERFWVLSGARDSGITNGKSIAHWLFERGWIDLAPLQKVVDELMHSRQQAKERQPGKQSE